MDRIVLAYSGGLEESAAISWLAGKYRAEVVTLTLDVGQGQTLDDARERALASGAVRAHLLDAREEFAREFVLPALHAGATSGKYGDPLATALTHPLIAKKLIEIAQIEGAKAIAHCERGAGSTPSGIDLAIRALDPAIKVIVLAQVWGLSPAELTRYAKDRGIPVPPNAERSDRSDATLWGRSIECGLVADSWHDVPEDLYTLTKSPAEAPDHAAEVELEFDRGVPMTLNGIAMSLVELIQCLDTIAGAHAIGRGDKADAAISGGKSRMIFEAPAATALRLAHQDLQHFVTMPDLARVADELAIRYADVVERGAWYSPLREAIDAFVANVQNNVSGTVRLTFFKGDCRVSGRSAAREATGTDQRTDARRKSTRELTSR